jgi:hypothetical protein
LIEIGGSGTASLPFSFVLPALFVWSRRRLKQTKIGDFLFFAVLVNLEIFGLQISDDFTALVRNRYVNLYQSRRNFDHIVIFAGFGVGVVV